MIDIPPFNKYPTLVYKEHSRLKRFKRILSSAGNVLECNIKHHDQSRRDGTRVEEGHKVKGADCIVAD